MQQVQVHIATLKTQNFSSPELAPRRQEHCEPVMLRSGFRRSRDLSD